MSDTDSNFYIFSVLSSYRRIKLYGWAASNRGSAVVLSISFPGSELSTTGFLLVLVLLFSLCSFHSCVSTSNQPYSFCCCRRHVSYLDLSRPFHHSARLEKSPGVNLRLAGWLATVARGGTCGFLFFLSSVVPCRSLPHTATLFTLLLRAPRR